MKYRLSVLALLAGFTLLFSAGCAVVSNGTTQMVVVRSAPEGATGYINGIAVGQTPFKIELSRSDVATIELRKDGFESASLVVMPVANKYAKRYLRWGIDYDLGAMTDLTPADISVGLRPAVQTTASADRFAQMSAQVTRADAMLAAGQITPHDHQLIVAQIVKYFSK